jgi:hnRNP-L/PTB/hephaestus splicing factor
MFQGCCTLRIAFSTRPSIIVKQQSAKSRDFTQPYSVGAAGAFGGVGGALVGGMGGADPYGWGLGGLGLAQAANQQALQQQQVVQQQQAFGGGVASSGHGAGSPVVLVNKLSPNATHDMLFTLFGLYGDVIRIKVLYNKKDTCMIQFSNAQQAVLAVQNLNKVNLCGQELVVSPSKNYEVKIPKPEQEEAHSGLTKDYTGSPLHRYKKTGQINAKNVNPPSQVLHVANISEGSTEADLAQVFQTAQASGSPPLVQFFTTTRKMAYVRMDSVADAVRGLIQCHNHKLGSWNIRVSFSHKDPNSFGKEGMGGGEDESKLQGELVQ